MPKKLNRVLIMAGGTGGHVFPGLALAATLQAQGVDVQWLGTTQGLEAKLVPAANIPLHTIGIAGLRGKGIKAMLKAPLKIISAIKQSYSILSAQRPDVVIGMGGFASGPGGVASALHRIPLVIHEQNAKAGLTNKLLAHLAKKVLAGFPGAFPPQNKLAVVGNPVRQAIEQLPPPRQRLQTMHVLVLGGSLGAQALNEIVPAALKNLPENLRPEVRHQAGEKHIAEAKKHYESRGLQANLMPFINDMAEAYAWADLVICRAGALTIAELCAAGTPAILVPYPHAVDDHQTANANFMVQQQAAICVQQSELSAEHLAGLLQQLAENPEQRLSMAKAAYSLRKIDVADEIFAILRDVVC